MDVANRIRAKLTEALAPVRLEIVDDSHRHKGHAGHDPRGESHFSVTVVSEAFRGKSRVERHRQVNALLAEELRERVHALALRTLTPDEAA
ncbi:BolA family protein [Arenibaculum pallidiluteum]|uniref:BolA family protein n=1 Tax=Arenibaculum pallidiluteum TaxID=2812559 RepID=UPI001A95C95A|nr:BolA family protein [Arenibaculum pallidiluteum]